TGMATPSGRLRALVLATTTGSESMPASLVRTALGLRSTWISLGVLRLDKPTGGPIVFGSTTHLAGIGRGLGTPRLASSPDGTSWSPVRALTPDAAGAVALDVEPRRL